MTDSPSIWTKVDFDLVSETPAREPVDPEVARRQGREMRRVRRVLDFFGYLLWGYALTKVLVVDIDRRLLGDLADYRFFYFVFVAVAVVVVVLVRKVWKIFLSVLYVAFFPLVVVCWKLPRALYRTKSWVAFFAVFNVVSSAVVNLRWVVVAFGVFAFSALAILGSGPRLLVVASVVAVALLFGVSVARAIRRATTSSPFIGLHERAVERAVDSGVVRQLTSVNDEWRSAPVEKFHPQDQQAFIQALSQGVIVHRALYFWAYQLDQYRRSPASVFLNVLAFLGLVGQTIVAFTLINKGLYLLDHQHFEYVTRPTFLVFLRYSVVSLWGGEIEALHAHSDLANAASIATTLIGGLVILTLFVGVLMNVRQMRDQTEIRQTIRAIRAEGEKTNERLKVEFDVSADEAVERLSQLRSAMLGVITFFSARTPPGWEGEEPQP